MAAQIPGLPQSLKAVQHYLKTAQEHDKRDDIIAYYCRLYTLQKAMEIDKKSPEARSFLMALMDMTEKTKKTLKEKEAISSETVGQAYVEDYALKVFLYADNEDRAGRFTKSVVKSFYTAGMLFDVLSVFGDLSEDLAKHSKYAKWKAAYIHKCLKTGEAPIPGPVAAGEDEELVAGGAAALAAGGGYTGGLVDFSSDPTDVGQVGGPLRGPIGVGSSTGELKPSSLAQPEAAPRRNISAAVPAAQPPAAGAGASLSAEVYQKAMKYCKFATSALQYEDGSAAIENLDKALKLLRTGKES